MASPELISSTELATAGSPPPPKGAFARFWRTLKQIFHEVVGGIFGVLAFAWLQSAVRAWTRDASRWLVFAAIGVTILLAVFSWTSFRRARQLR
jgi:hypothetical protein